LLAAYELGLSIRSTVLLIAGISKVALCRRCKVFEEVGEMEAGGDDVQVMMPEALIYVCRIAFFCSCPPRRTSAKQIKSPDYGHVSLVITPKSFRMPRVLARTPEWLVPPSPGFNLFSAKPSKPTDQHTSEKEQEYYGPSRTIAHGRGTEVFVAQGNELRWANLKSLRDGCENTEEVDEQSKRRSATWYKDSFDSAYKVGPGFYILIELN
jgi:hypothetical protein